MYQLAEAPLPDLPERPTAERDAIILEHLSRGATLPITWSPIRINWRGHTAIIRVMSDALRLGDGTRLTVRYSTAQRIADDRGLSLLTPLVSDEIWQQADVRIPPVMLNATHADLANMSMTSRMRLHSSRVDALTAGRRGLVATVGKDWIITKTRAGKLRQPRTNLPTAPNYGWHDPRAPYTRPGRQGILRMWQTPGLRHDIGHTDYSQVCRFMQVMAIVDGAERDVRELMTSEGLWGLVSDEGRLPFYRHPLL